MHQHLKVNELVAAAYAAVPTLPPAEAKLMREVATRLSVTFVALTESIEQSKVITADRDELNQQVVNLAVELSVVESIHTEAVFITDELYDKCPGKVQRIIRSLAVMKMPATAEFLENTQAQGVEKFGKLTMEIGEEEQDSSIIYAGQQAILFAAQLRKGEVK